MSRHAQSRAHPSSDLPSSAHELDLLAAYNLADQIQTDWERSAVPEYEALAIRWLDTDTGAVVDLDASVAVDDAAVSETESIVADDDYGSRGAPARDGLQQPRQSGTAHNTSGRLDDEVSDDGEADADDDDDYDEEDLESFYMWPKYMDSLVYRLYPEILVSKFLMNKPERKVYFGHRSSDQLPVVVVVGKEYDPRLRHNNVPREVNIMMHLRGQANVAEILGWCPVGKRHFVLVLRHYQSADFIDASAKNMYTISKMVESVLKALKQVHDRRVVHRDVAKSNLLWNPLTETAVIIDFDNSCFFRPKGYYRDVGRDSYDAPEKTELLEVRRKLKAKLAESHKKHKHAEKIKKRMKAYTEKADVYSVGVLMWMLLNGEHHSPSPRKLKEWVAKIEQRNRHKKYAELNLLVRLLRADPDRRISVEEALAHPFIQERPAEPDPDYANMKAYLLKKLATARDEDEAAASDKDDDDEKKAEANHKGRHEQHEAVSRSSSASRTSASSSSSSSAPSAAEESSLHSSAEEETKPVTNNTTATTTTTTTTQPASTEAAKISADVTTPATSTSTSTTIPGPKSKAPFLFAVSKPKTL